VFHQTWCYDGLLFVFQFCRAVWLWVWLTGSGDELLDLLPALLQGVAYPPPAVSLLAYLHLFIDSSAEISSLSLSLPTPHALSAILLLPLCARLQFAVYCSGFFFGGEVSLLRGLHWFIPGVAGKIPCDVWCSPVWSAECLTGSFGALR
jgi:hypothetical protein